MGVIEAFFIYVLSFLLLRNALLRVGGGVLGFSDKILRDLLTLVVCR
jgi:hypothetical protein